MARSTGEQGCLALLTGILKGSELRMTLQTQERQMNGQARGSQVSTPQLISAFPRK